MPEILRGVAALLGGDTDAIEDVLRVPVGGAAEDVEGVGGVLGEGRAEAALGDGVLGLIDDLVVVVRVVDIPVPAVEDATLGAGDEAPGVVGDVGHAGADVDRTVVERDVDAERIPVVGLRDDDVVVARGGDRRGRELDVGLILLVGGLDVERDVLGQVVAERRVDAEALGGGREPDELLEVVEVRRVALGREPLRLERARARRAERAAGGVAVRAGEARRGRSERASDDPTGTGQAGDGSARGEAGDVDAVHAVDLASGGAGQTDAGLRARAGAKVEGAGGDVVRVIRTPGRKAGREVGVVRERGIRGAQRGALEVGDTDRRAGLAAGGAAEERVGLLGDVRLERVAVAHAHLGAGVVLAQDDVDHARGGVRAIDGGSAVLEHLNALDHRDREAVEVDEHRAARVVARGGDATAVDDNQSVVGAQTAEVEGGGAADRGDRAGLVDADVAALRELAEEVGEVGAARHIDVGAVDDLDR